MIRLLGELLCEMEYNTRLMFSQSPLGVKVYMGVLQRHGRSGRQHPGGRVARFGRYGARFCMYGNSTRYMVVDLVLGWSIRRLPFRLPCLLDSPAPAQQHRRLNGRAHPHFTTAQQFYNPCI